MPTFRAPRGTRDLLPPETATWTRLERLAADLATRYGYRRIETPLFELTDVEFVNEALGYRSAQTIQVAPALAHSESIAVDPKLMSGVGAMHGGAIVSLIDPPLIMPSPSIFVRITGALSMILSRIIPRCR